MNTTFKAVDGWTFDHDIEEIFDGQEGVVDGRLYQRSPEDMKCTIIPGHWADRIESGELLTVEELSECYAEHLCEYEAFANNGRIGEEPSYEHLLMKTIARKLRGEAQPKMKGNDNA